MKSFNIQTMRRELKNDMNKKSKNELIRLLADLSEQYLRLASMAEELMKEYKKVTKGTYDEDTNNSPSASTESISSSKDSINSKEHSSS